jgi:hypothetical protein
MYNKMKKCNKCGEIKSLDLFTKTKRSKDGYMYYCKKCHGIQIKNSRHKYVEYDKQYAKDNWLKKKTDPEYQLKHKEYQREYKRKRRQCSTFRLKENLRTYFYRTITHKSKSAFKYLGCSIEEFKKYIEQQFSPEMNWENYGTYWEIDHIKPIDSFNFLIEQEVYECWNYNNLQPLTINENKRKSNKYE